MKSDQKVQLSKKRNQKKVDPQYAYLCSCIALLVNDEVDTVSLRNIPSILVEKYMARGIFRSQIIWDREGAQLLHRNN